VNDAAFYSFLALTSAEQAAFCERVNRFGGSRPGHIQLTAKVNQTTTERTTA
jgi:hypothetical protein